MDIRRHIMASRRRTAGLTILEAMVTMAALASGIAAISMTTNYISQWSGESRRRFLAASLAELVIEEARSFGCNPNLANAPCARLLTWPANGDEAGTAEFPRYYCWPSKGDPFLVADNAADCDVRDGLLFEADIMVATSNQVSVNSVVTGVGMANYTDFNRRRLENGVIPATNNVTLDNVANIRVTIRWNDILPAEVADRTHTRAKIPKFFVYQTRVTQ